MMENEEKSKKTEPDESETLYLNYLDKITESLFIFPLIIY